jgi:hypothetical protein
MMNRREALQAGIGVLSAMSIDGEVATISPKDPQAVVITLSSKLSLEEKKQLMDGWKSAFSGKPLGSIPLIILDPGAKLEVIDSQ